jgi:hypothetical protein
MLNTIVGAGAVGAGAASRYGSGSGSDQKMRLLAAPAPQHCCALLSHDLSDEKMSIMVHQGFFSKYIFVKIVHVHQKFYFF